MKQLFQTFWKEEEGNFMEYVLLIALAGVVIAAIFPGIRTKVMTWFKETIARMDAGIGDGEECSGLVGDTKTECENSTTKSSDNTYGG